MKASRDVLVPGRFCAYLPILLYARSKGKASTSARVFAPAASITRRSKPKATPVQGGRPACIAASSRLSSGRGCFAVGHALGVRDFVPPTQFLGIEQFVIAVGQFDPLDIQARTVRPPADFPGG